MSWRSFRGSDSTGCQKLIAQLRRRLVVVFVKRYAIEKEQLAAKLARSLSRLIGKSGFAVRLQRRVNDRLGVSIIFAIRRVVPFGLQSFQLEASLCIPGCRRLTLQVNQRVCDA